MHYRNGREAKNGDKIVKLDGARTILMATCGLSGWRTFARR